MPFGIVEGSEGEYLTDRLTSEAIKFVEQTKDKPFFLYMAHHAVHTPLKAPQTLVDKYQKKTKGKYQTNAIYAAMVENLDWNVGRLCHAIDSLGLSEIRLLSFILIMEVLRQQPIISGLEEPKECLMKEESEFRL